jgi:hypothetical protein
MHRILLKLGELCGNQRREVRIVSRAQMKLHINVKRETV